MYANDISQNVFAIVSCFCMLFENSYSQNCIVGIICAFRESQKSEGFLMAFSMRTEGRGWEEGRQKIVAGNDVKFL